MNYREADAKLTGRNKQSKKLANNTYLRRAIYGGKEKGSIAVRLHNTDVLTFYPNGAIQVANGGFPTVTTHDRINNCLPKGFRVFGEPVETRRTNGRGMTILRKYKVDGGSPWSAKTLAEVCVDSVASISARGKLTGGNVVKYRADRKEARAEEMRPINRGRYWLRKSEGIHVDRSKCFTKDETNTVAGWQEGTMRKVQRYDCGLYGRSGARARSLASGETEKTLACGCRVFYVAPSAKGITVSGILAEDNATVKAAQLKIYGIEKFFEDAKPTVLDEVGTYQLLQIETSPNVRQDWQKTYLRALKMVCSTTGNVHLHAVPARECDTVAKALNWIYNLPEGSDYLRDIGQQS